MSEIGKPIKEWQIDEPQLVPENPKKHEDSENNPPETEKELEKRVEEVEIGV